MVENKYFYSAIVSKQTLLELICGDGGLLWISASAIAIGVRVSTTGTPTVFKALEAGEKGGILVDSLW